VGAVKDPELKAEAERSNYELDPVAGEDMEKLAKEVMSQPQTVIDQNEKITEELRLILVSDKPSKSTAVRNYSQYIRQSSIGTTPMRLFASPAGAIFRAS
jgi:hypothetical protein